MVVHDNVVTSQGIGSALVCAIMLVELLYDSDLANRVALTMFVDRTKYQYFPSSFDPKVHMGGHALYRARILVKYWKTLNNGYSLETIQKMSRVDDVGDTYERCQHDGDVMALNNIGAQLPCTHNVQVYEVGA